MLNGDNTRLDSLILHITKKKKNERVKINTSKRCKSLYKEHHTTMESFSKAKKCNLKLIQKAKKLLGNLAICNSVQNQRTKTF